MNPTVSVVIPTYDRLPQLEEAIKSALRQTVPAHEVLVVDDGSTDGTAEVIEARFGSAVRVLRQENAGVAAARNLGIRQATGEWIALLDSDDLWRPTKLECQLNAVSAQEKPGVEWVCFTNNSFGGDARMTQSFFEMCAFAPSGATGVLEDPAELILGGTEPFYTSSFLIPRALLLRAGLFDEAMVVREDTELFFRLSLFAQFVYVAEPLVEIDRTPGRVLGLCNLFATRDERKHRSFKTMYRNWLALPGVRGSKYEGRIRDLQRGAYCNSIESKIHQLRPGAVLREVAEANAAGVGALVLIESLLMRKARKVLAHLPSWRFRPASKRMGAETAR